MEALLQISKPEELNFSQAMQLSLVFNLSSLGLPTILLEMAH